MISRASSSAPPDGNRGLRVALVASVIVHVLVGLLVLAANDGFHRLLARIDVPHRIRRPQDEVVTISSALRLEKRARPVAAVPARPPAVPPQRIARPQPHVRPRIAQPPSAVAVAKPAYRAPALLRHELAKIAPRKPEQPAKSRRGRASALPARTAPPGGQQVASVEHAPSHESPRARPATATLSDRRLAQIERDLAKTIAQERSQVNPLRTASRAPPAAPKRYRIQMQGRFGELRRGEGYYFPIKAWHADGLDYYYVSYEFTYPDGTYEAGSVPWPIHFAPKMDPFEREDLGLLHRTPLPAPPPDYLPPGTLGKALRAYFPKLRFGDDG